MHTTEELLASTPTRLLASISTTLVPSSRSEEWKDDSQPTLVRLVVVWIIVFFTRLCIVRALSNIMEQYSSE
jgi:hypothetical protein